MVAKYKSPLSDFPPPGAPAPKQRTMTGPSYVYFGKKPVHVDDEGAVRYLRPYLETRQAVAEPDGAGFYTVHKYTRIDLHDEGALAIEPEMSEWFTDLKKYSQEAAAAEMVKLMAAWKSEGFVIDNITPDTVSLKPAP